MCFWVYSSPPSRSMTAAYTGQNYLWCESLACPLKDGVSHFEFRFYHICKEKCTYIQYQCQFNGRQIDLLLPVTLLTI